MHHNAVADLPHVFLQVPVPLLLFLRLVVLMVGVVVGEHRQEEVARGVEGHVVVVGYVELQCFFMRSMMLETQEIRRWPFQPTHPIGVHFGQRLLHNAMTTTVEFFNLFFTVELINNIVTHTNIDAYEHIETHQSYAKSAGSWQEATADEIRRLMAILIYFGLVRVSDAVDNYWSVRSPYLDLWGKCFLSRITFKRLFGLSKAKKVALQV